MAKQKKSQMESNQQIKIVKNKKNQNNIISGRIVDTLFSKLNRPKGQNMLLLIQGTASNLSGLFPSKFIHFVTSFLIPSTC